MDYSNLKTGDIVYILAKYTPDGDIKVVEVEIYKTLLNGKVYAFATLNEPGEFVFRQSDINCVFRTREDAEKALKEEKK